MSATLMIMAAGMGSRYGGNKQIDGMGPNNEILMEYSIYDAIEAGFTKVIFILKDGMKEDFHKNWGEKIARKIEVAYAIQSFDNLPGNYTVPAERVKPFGTVHAILSAKNIVKEPFAVINADDYYGKESFQLIYNHLQNIATEKEACMAGYYLKNTISKHGHVTRGVCKTDEKGILTSIEETYEIRAFEDGTIRDTYHNPEGNVLEPTSPVSMNFFGFTPWLLEKAEEHLIKFLENIPDGNIKAEYVLPTLVDDLMKYEGLKVKVIPTSATWFGVTYKEDRPIVVGKLQALHNDGSYPSPLL
ncbi:MAG: sugar phosphate nucleotidyltransferase [Eubacteriales bacterium]|nr:sugar phosphate nucleotidyltransferase [Eubacteriales bacterium]